MSKDYNPVTQKQFGRGMVTVKEPHDIPDDGGIYIQNMDIGSGGAFGPRLGCTLHGNRTSGNGRILSTFTCKLRNGTEVPIRLRSDPDNSKAVLDWYNSVADAWELLWDPATDFDDETRMGFVQWNTSAQDRVYMCNGVQAYVKWTCEFSTVASNAATTITLIDGSAFPASGTVIVDGVEYAYTGRTGNQLTGLAALPTFTVGEGVALIPSNPNMKTTIAVTITIASPGVVSLTAHGFAAGDTVRFTTTGALPTGITAGTTYYVIAAGLTANAFEISTQPSGSAVNTSGSQSGTHYLSIPLSNVFIAHLSRLWIGKFSVMFYSKTGDPEDFSQASPRVPGDGGIEDFPEGGGEITGFASRDEVLVVMKKDVIRTFLFNQTDIATNEIPVSKPLGFSSNIGPQNAASVTTQMKEVFYASQRYGLRQLTQVLQSTTSPTPALDMLTLHDDIAPTVKEFDFDDAAAKTFDQKILTACKSDPDNTVNDIIIAFDFRVKGNVIYKGWNVNDWYEYLGELYFGNSGEPNCFKCFDGYSDDSGPIESIFQSKRWNFGEPALRKDVDLFYIEGRIGDGTDIEVTINLDDEGATQQIEKIIESDGDYVTANVAGSLGADELGVQALGGTIEAGEDLNKFRVYLTLPKTFHYSIEAVIKSSSLGGRYKIDAFAMNPKAQREPSAAKKL